MTLTFFLSNTILLLILLKIAGNVSEYNSTEKVASQHKEVFRANLYFINIVNIAIILITAFWGTNFVMQNINIIFIILIIAELIIWGSFFFMINAALNSTFNKGGN